MAEVLSINRIPADFVANTRHLSVEDRGAYQEILDQIVLLGQDEDPPSLPDDDHFIARLLGWPAKKWRNTKQRLCSGTGAVLVQGNARLTQARIVEEIEAARARINQAKIAGIASGKKRRKTATLRERLANGSSTPVQREFNPRSTPVPTGVQQEFNRSTNGSPTGGATQREPAINHELRTTKEEEPFASVTTLLPSEILTAPRIEEPPPVGIDAIEMLAKVTAICCPKAEPLDDFTASRWLRDFNRDPYWIACAIFDAKAGSVSSGDDAMARARNAGYLTKVIQGRVTTGWVPECGEDQARSFVDFKLAPREAP